MSRRNIFTNIIGIGLSVYGANEFANAKMTLEKFVATVPTAIVAFATGVTDDKLARLTRHMDEDDRHAARNIGRLMLDRVLSRFGYEVALRQPEVEERAVVRDYGDRATGNSPDVLMTGIQPENAKAAAWEAVRHERRRLNMPQIGQREMTDWQDFNQQGFAKAGNDEVIGTEGWP